MNSLKLPISLYFSQVYYITMGSKNTNDHINLVSKFLLLVKLYHSSFKTQ